MVYPVKPIYGVLSDDDIARFYSKVPAGLGTDECWLWLGAPSGNGRGQLWADGKTYCASRVAWVLDNDCEIPSGLAVMHLCADAAVTRGESLAEVFGYRMCVNPAHLEPDTQGRNSAKGLTGANYRDRIACPAGHPYEGDNIRWKANGNRSCRICSVHLNRVCASWERRACHWLGIPQSVYRAAYGQSQETAKQILEDAGFDLETVENEILWELEERFSD